MGGRPAYATRAALEAEAPPATLQRRIEVGRGDTLMNLLVEAGAERGQAHAANTALQRVYEPKALKPGQEIFLTVFKRLERFEEKAFMQANLPT